MHTALHLSRIASASLRLVFRCGPHERRFIHYAGDVRTGSRTLPAPVPASSARDRRLPGLHGCLVCVLGSAVLAAEAKDQQDESEIILSMKRAVLAMQREEYRRAERFLHVALRQAQQQQRQDAVSYIYSLLADCALRQQDLERAERLLTELTRRLAATAGTADNSFVDVSLKLASVYAARGDPEKAEAGFQYCIDTQRRKIDDVGEEQVDADTLALWGMAVDWYARFLSRRGEHVRARDLAARALEVSVRLTGETGEQSLVLLSDLGTLEARCGNDARAVELLTGAVELGKQQQHDDLSAFHVNLGLVHLQQGMTAEAERECSAGAMLAGRRADAVAAAEASHCLAKVKQALAENPAS